MQSMKNAASKKQSKEVPIACEAPDFPYGLRLSLNDDTLKKLKMKAEDFEMDEEFFLTAKVSVVGVSVDKTASGQRSSVDLQITELEIRDEADEAMKIWEEAYENGGK
jgi:hypothetical protein